VEPLATVPNPLETDGQSLFTAGWHWTRALSLPQHCSFETYFSAPIPLHLLERIRVLLVPDTPEPRVWVGQCAEPVQEESRNSNVQ